MPQWEQPTSEIHREPIAEDQPTDGSMPLEISRWELFSQFRALAGLSLADAYLQAGGRKNVNAQRQGAKISGREPVKKRIEWLKAEQARKMQDGAVMSKRSILEELKTNMELGRVLKGSLNASNRALELIGGEEHDMFVVRRENRNKKIDELDGMDTDQLIEFIQKAAARIPGLEIDAEKLAAAVGAKPESASGGGRPAGNRAPDPRLELPAGEDV
jgi:hypothetical protein